MSSVMPNGGVMLVEEVGRTDGPLDYAATALMYVAGAALAVSPVRWAIAVVCIIVAITLKFIECWLEWRRKPQCKLVEGVPELGGIAITKELHNYSRKHKVTYEDLLGTITGISCLPVDRYTPSPEAEVISGGLNCSRVTILLSPPKEGRWSCKLCICTRPY